MLCECFHSSLYGCGSDDAGNGNCTIHQQRISAFHEICQRTTSCSSSESRRSSVGNARTACDAVSYACDRIEPSLSDVLDLKAVLDMLSKRTYHLDELCFVVNLFCVGTQTRKYSRIERFGNRFHSLERVYVDHTWNEVRKSGVYRTCSLCFGLECSS